ncbi:MAG: tetratricopeptide repeat protein [Microcystis panniformis Mp_MB_F_20051200_S9]|uniref:Tetratricopeptide repeat protein n=1 Tax=Microcystis panniformis Mp_MB_F_20051200_S9 TaxID=2486223 RepID=A0A552QAY5_9CHRO|nr:MAG: tetratricopeptide repeat protein [Microcystis panniformis Mp_GB_SS_20050300_S99]TRV51478.1 MAG: tetratricopeptide repeat protein [Microcystis panniformis Mp_GB_SS_20050300_S99D]TRV51970.1 MAG: tetratricopeptide repeat protein [Microcystis panniformis Mp_MB_F_20080800_S26D]TRV56575.1 MAG: tetratricopeptide repeat protein [Microcystis panniformis Mp_MB_F_20051200_S9D]TRV61467.1 MAG: tetratricopeptide repeat protein [Microcystis panniformis Mp_MB_F_20080800_S26]TRV66367.1 MAG: tetratricop
MRNVGYNEAINSYQKALSEDKQFWPALHNIGLIRYEQGDTKAALKAWNEAVSIDNKHPEPQLAIAVALFKQGNKNQAIKLGQAALALDNRYGKITFLEENLWGKTLLQDTQLFFALPQIQSIIKDSSPTSFPHE